VQVFHFAETKAMVPVTRELASLRYSLEDLAGSAAKGVEQEKETTAGKRGRLSTRRLGQLVPNAVLHCQKASKDLLELVLTFERRVRVPESLVRERRYQTVTFTQSADIFWRPETGFCFITDVPGRALKAATWMLSAAVLGYPGRLSPVEIDTARMKRIIKFVTSPPQGGPGELMRAVFREVQLGRGQLDEVNIRARELHNHPLYREVEKGAGELHAIGFMTPLIKGIDRSLACRLDAQGRALVYAPRLRPDELRALLQFFEQMLSA
jgi:hypothetical protein